jgi:hypothetical protein
LLFLNVGDTEGQKEKGDLPVIFCCFDKIIDLRVHELEDPLLGCLFIVLELFCGREDDGSAC